VLVYSITARATFERIERFRNQIARVKDSDTTPIILVGNKSDRANEREVGREEGLALAKRLGCAFIETSAKTRSNLDEAYYTVVRMSESSSILTAILDDTDDGMLPVREQRGGVVGKPVKKPKRIRKCSIL
jgi:GTPase KRas protein